jgi:hypothetical protein
VPLDDDAARAAPDRDRDPHAQRDHPGRTIAFTGDSRATIKQEESA